MSSNENLQDATDFSSDASPQQENVVHDSINHGCAISTHEIAEKANDVLEVIASTGKFWHNWDKLKNMLSFQLKQVWGEYPEAKMSSNEQISPLGETSAELVGRLDEALCSFTEGPPFTLQRLCEILLNARSIYPNLSKLALALEKNLLVTSTLTMSTGPYPSEATENINEADKGRPEVQSRSNSVPNCVESEKDEVMAEAEESGSGDGMAIDTEGEALKEK